MNTVNSEMGVKVVVCAAAALALTLMGSWSFVESTSTTQHGANVSNVTESLGEIVISSARQVAQNSPAVLVD
jgi:hypothetical protein